MTQASEVTRSTIDAVVSSLVEKTIKEKIYATLKIESRIFKSFPHGNEPRIETQPELIAVVMNAWSRVPAAFQATVESFMDSLFTERITDDAMKTVKEKIEKETTRRNRHHFNDLYSSSYDIRKGVEYWASEKAKRDAQAIRVHISLFVAIRFRKAIDAELARRKNDEARWLEDAQDRAKRRYWRLRSVKDLECKISELTNHLNYLRKGPSTAATESQRYDQRYEIVDQLGKMVVIAKHRATEE